MVFPESKELKDSQDHKEEMAEKDHVEPQANQVVLSQFQDRKAHLGLQDNQENQDLKDSRVKTANHSKDHPDSQVMLASPEEKDALDQLDLPAQQEIQARRDLANTAHLPALHPVIKNLLPEGLGSSNPWLNPLFVSFILTIFPQSKLHKI